jgi:hypothetical protein
MFLFQRPGELWDLASLVCDGYRVVSLGVKLKGREADQSSPSLAEVTSPDIIMA